MLTRWGSAGFSWMSCLYRGHAPPGSRISFRAAAFLISFTSGELAVATRGPCGVFVLFINFPRPPPPHLALNIEVPRDEVFNSRTVLASVSDTAWVKGSAFGGSTDIS